jgi:hypothetical protein
LFGDGGEPFRKIFQIEFEAGEVPFNARKILTFLTRLMLLEMKNVAAMPVDEIGDRRIQPLAVRALHQEHGTVSQRASPASLRILLDLPGHPSGSIDPVACVSYTDVLSLRVTSHLSGLFF